jgi:hypothetical protein
MRSNKVSRRAKAFEEPLFPRVLAFSPSAARCWRVSSAAGGLSANDAKGLLHSVSIRAVIDDIASRNQQLVCDQQVWTYLLNYGFELFISYVK